MQITSGISRGVVIHVVVVWFIAVKSMDSQNRLVFGSYLWTVAMASDVRKNLDLLLEAGKNVDIVFQIIFFVTKFIYLREILLLEPHFVAWNWPR